MPPRTPTPAENELALHAHAALDQVRHDSLEDKILALEKKVDAGFTDLKTAVKETHTAITALASKPQPEGIRLGWKELLVLLGLITGGGLLGGGAKQVIDGAMNDAKAETKTDAP